MHDYAAVAAHYAAYRPALHETILARLLGGETYGLGVDIGCGTGRSAAALAKYAAQVIGVEPSAEMRAAAEPHPKVEIRPGDGGALPVEDGAADIATLAGVLSYLDREALAGELSRACRPGAPILIYDFEIDLSPLTELLGFEKGEAGAYDHAANLSDHPRFDTETRFADTDEVEASAAQAAHVYLSGDARLASAAERFGTPDPFQHVAARIDEAGWRSRLTARIWGARHALRP